MALTGLSCTAGKPVKTAEHAHANYTTYSLDNKIDITFTMQHLPENNVKFLI